METDPYSYAIKAFCGKWKPYIIRGIQYDEITRFSRFTKQLPITEKVLSSTLKELEADGIIERTAYPEIPPRVEYNLTELGTTILPILDMLYKWGWEQMKLKGMEIDTLGEMWHGFREQNFEIMNDPYKNK